MALKTVLKILSIRGKPEHFAVFDEIQALSGSQDNDRKHMFLDITNHIYSLPLNQETRDTLLRASKRKNDVSQITETAHQIKLIIDVQEEVWSKAMEVFKYAFHLTNSPQMPYFLRVAGNAYIEFLKEQNQKLGVDVPEIAEKKTFNDALSIEEFTALSSVEDKLVEIYKLLLSERGLL